MAQPVNNARFHNCVAVLAGVLAALLWATGCSSKIDIPPPTVEPARAAVSPPTTATPAGRVLPLTGRPASALFDPATSALVVFTPGAGGEAAGLTLFGPSGPARSLPLPGPAASIAGDGQGGAYAATRGGYFSVDLRTGTATKVDVRGEADTDFTAVARRGDGRLVLGTADGAAVTLGSPAGAPEQAAVAEKAEIFARVDAIVTEGDNAVVLDRAQSSVTALDAEGKPQQSLRAGEGATTLAADSAGRILVTDTRAGQLLVFGVDPLIERQAYPVPEAPYGLAGSRDLVWVSQTAANTVVGYDLSTGIPVEKVRYPTVQQPDSLAFDERSGTLYVVSGTGAGVQVIPDAAGAR